MNLPSIPIKTLHGVKKIGHDEPCFVIAEMSANHEQKLDQAFALVRAAADAGADAIKLQTYTADSMTIDSNEPWFRVDGEHNPASWKSETFYSLYQKAFTPREWHKPLQELAESLGLVFFSTPYSADDVDFLETLHVPLYKIASYECTDIPLLKKIAATGKPIIMSVGFATEEEIAVSVAALRSAGATDIILLHCVTSYTDKPDETKTNLATMADIETRFHALSGFSDNNGGIDMPVLAAALGSAVIEKHLALDTASAAFDARFSLSPASFKDMVARIRWNERATGSVQYGPQTDAEKHNRRFRRSLFSVLDIKKGEALTKENIRSIRPADGLEPIFFEEILGKSAASDIRRGTPLAWNLIIR